MTTVRNLATNLSVKLFKPIFDVFGVLVVFKDILESEIIISNQVSNVVAHHPKFLNVHDKIACVKKRTNVSKQPFLKIRNLFRISPVVDFKHLSEQVLII